MISLAATSRWPSGGYPVLGVLMPPRCHGADVAGASCANHPLQPATRNPKPPLTDPGGAFPGARTRGCNPIPPSRGAGLAREPRFGEPGGRNPQPGTGT